MAELQRRKSLLLPFPSLHSLSACGQTHPTGVRSYSGRPKTESGRSFSRWIRRTSHRLHPGRGDCSLSRRDPTPNRGSSKSCSMCFCCVFLFLSFFFFVCFTRKEHLRVLKASPNVFMLIHSVTGRAKRQLGTQALHTPREANAATVKGCCVGSEAQ